MSKPTPRMPQPTRQSAPSWPASIARPIAIVLIAYGTWTLPLGYFLGFNTSSYPTPMKVLLGTAGILSGIGILQRRPWAPWLGIAFLLTQLASVQMPGFAYETVLSIGFWFRFLMSGQPVALHLNVAALIMIVFLIAHGASSLRPPRDPSRTSRS
jgi:hypothetical protein